VPAVIHISQLGKLRQRAAKSPAQITETVESRAQIPVRVAAGLATQSALNHFLVKHPVSANDHRVKTSVHCTDVRPKGGVDGPER
jgi:hypothetical protein